MKTLSLFTLLIVVQIFYAQEKKIEVDYDFIIAGDFLDDKMKKDPMMVSIFEGIEKAAMQSKFKLIAQNNISIFKVVETMPLDNETSGEEIAKIMNRSNSIFYKNTKEKIFIEDSDDFSNHYFINRDYEKTVWELTTDSKFINNFLCYKAIGSEKDRQKSIFAWFCPEIPFGFGPIEFGNLPGLILELTFGPITYIASKIDFNSKSDLKLELPTKDLISSEEYSKKVNEFRENRMRK